MFLWANANAGDAFYRERTFRHRTATTGKIPTRKWPMSPAILRFAQVSVNSPPRSRPPGSELFPSPALIADAGEKAAEHFLEYFATSIRNPNTRAAYVQAAGATCPSSTKEAVPRVTKTPRYSRIKNSIAVLKMRC